jgi:hypothetical protein
MKVWTSKKPPLTVMTATATLALIISGQTLAVTSSPTETVKGRAPSITTATFTGESTSIGFPMVADVLTGGYTGYSDLDGDPEEGSTVRWLIDGAEVSTGPTYVPTMADKDKDLTVEVTPRSAHPADPAQGAPVSLTRNVLFYDPSRWVVHPTRLDWQAADNYCRITVGGGARLPTRVELRQTYLDGTRSKAGDGSTSSSDMCTVHGWPFGSGCDPYVNASYWTSDLGGDRYAFSMSQGHDFIAPAHVDYQVACIK